MSSRGQLLPAYDVIPQHRYGDSEPLVDGVAGERQEQVHDGEPHPEHLRAARVAQDEEVDRVDAEIGDETDEVGRSYSQQEDVGGVPHAGSAEHKDVQDVGDHAH